MSDSKNDLEQLKGILDQFSSDTIVEAVRSKGLERGLTPEPSPGQGLIIQHYHLASRESVSFQAAAVPKCKGTCTQVKRSLESVNTGTISATGTCGHVADPAAAVTTKIKADWEYDWEDENACTETGCTCGAQGNGAEVDRYTKTWPYSYTDTQGCTLNGTATFTVVKRRRSGECRA